MVAGTEAEWVPSGATEMSGAGTVVQVMRSADCWQVREQATLFWYRGFHVMPAMVPEASVH